MHHFDLIATLTGGLSAALFFGYLTHRMGLSPIVGYLFAGIVVGPHTPGFIANAQLAEQLAEIGVILLMFGVGLHFHVDDLLSVRRVALPGAIGQSLVATLCGAFIAHHFGWSWSAGFVFGIAVSVASTVVLLRVLTENRDLHTPTGHIAVGWLVVEDLFTVVVLVLLPTLWGAAQGGGQSVPLALGIAGAKIALLVVFTFYVGGRVIPWLLDKIAQTRSRELFTLTVLVVALGIAVGSAKVFGVSMALGAFLAGMVVGQSDFSLRAASDALPMRDAFAVLFFVSVGMLFDPARAFQSPGLLIATVMLVMVIKPLSAIVIVLALRYPMKVALSVGAALAQIGEFSFILAALGRELDILNEDATNILVATSILSITMNPLIYQVVGPLSRRLSGRGGRKREPGVTADNEQDPTDREKNADGGSRKHRAILVGYGPVGRTLTRLLQENEVEPTIIEMNMETVRQLKERKIHAIYGDAGQRQILDAAGVTEAGSLILTAGGMEATSEIIRAAKEANPRIRILARASYVREMPELFAAGAAQVFSGEGEVALAFIEAVLRPLGATAEQVDLERERFRATVNALPLKTH